MRAQVRFTDALHGQRLAIDHGGTCYLSLDMKPSCSLSVTSCAVDN